MGCVQAGRNAEQANSLLQVAEGAAQTIQGIAERMKELLEDPEITGKDIRTAPTATPTEGVGIVEAPRGTLIHHYCADERGILSYVNLLVATVHNSASIQMSPVIS